MRGLEDGVVQEKEEKERKPGGRLFRVYIRGWVLYGKTLIFGLGIEQLGFNEPWDRMEYTELE